MTDFRLLNNSTIRPWLILLLLLPSSLMSALPSSPARPKRQAAAFNTNTPPPAANDSQDSDGSTVPGGPGGLGSIGIVSSPNQTNAGGLGSIGIVSSPNQTNAGGLGSIGIVSSPNQTNAVSGCSLFQLFSGSCPTTGPTNEDRCNNTMCAQLQTDVCYNGGTCYEVDGQNCSCTCPPDFTDPQLYDWQCQRVTSEPDDTTKDCAGNGQFVCDNGHCVYHDSSQQSFDCKCDPGWIGDWCQTACGRNCSNGGQCELRQRNGTEEEVCVCPYPWIGSDCSQSPPEETTATPAPADTTWKWILGGSLAGGLLLVVVLAALVVFCLWKHHLPLIMKVVYYFKAYEDDDGLRYDAFVSYVSRKQDEDFVCRHLQPTLENEMLFKLCLHQRDFVVGNAITNNICEALEDSRRFILVISPRYLQSEWAEFEYQKAFHDMLKMKMRIVPIIIEEMGPDQALNPTLKAILQSVTYIQYPGAEASQQQLEKFWRRVHLSMPKRKNRECPEARGPVYDTPEEHVCQQTEDTYI